MLGNLTQEELDILREKAAAFDKVMSTFLAHTPQPENPNIQFKSLPNVKEVKNMAIWLMEGTAKLFRSEIEHSPPDSRNRFTVTVYFGNELWNLTLSRGDFEHVVEQQRNAARAERDEWIRRYVEAMANKKEPTSGSNVEDDCA